MRITCPYCHADARVTPNQETAISLPRYLLKCSGCNTAAVHPNPGKQRLHGSTRYPSTGIVP